MVTMILLDTNVLIWLMTDSEHLGPRARNEIASASAVFSSPMSIIEVRIKSMLGKLSVPEPFAELVRDSGVQELPLSHGDADAISAFPELARHDPFDRAIAAQAFQRGLALMTADRVLLALSRPFIRDARI